MVVGGVEVNNESKVLIIAEAGINHDGKLEQAYQLIDVAKEAGADVVKFQLFTAEKMYTPRAGNYITANGQKKNINEILKPVELQIEWIDLLMKYCRKKEIGFLCTVCDEEGVDVLNEKNVDAFKLASYGITFYPLLKKVAAVQKPVIISSAGAYLSDVDKAVRIIEGQGNKQIGLMHCVAKYPTPPEKCNLSILSMYKMAFPEVIIGYSDHTEDPISAPTCAVALGAKMIEKHFTIDKTLEGADHSFAVNPEQLKQMCDAIRETEEKMRKGEFVNYDKNLLGTSRKQVTDVEMHLRKYAYRTIIARKKIEKGEIFTRDNIDILRPGNEVRGLEPEMYELLLSGVQATKVIEEGEAVKWENILVIK